MTNDDKAKSLFIVAAVLLVCVGFIVAVACGFGCGVLFWLETIA